MKKIKYQGGLTKLIASEKAKRNKFRFARWTEKNLPALRSEFGKTTIPAEVVSFSSSRDLYDQVLSVLSFLRYVGTPLKWTIYSDGSHSPSDIGLLKEGFEFLTVRSIDWKKDDLFAPACKPELNPYKSELLAYANDHPLGKRLLVYLNYDIKHTTIFLDADILFYDKASVIHGVVNEKSNGWYLPDAEWGALDSRYVNNTGRQLYQVNGGFLIFNKNLDVLSEGMNFLKSLDDQYEYFSEQTVMHILLKANGFLPLDPRIFILNSDDQFDFSYLHPREKMAIRHYTGPVRHKMWQRNWKWHLALP